MADYYSIYLTELQQEVGYEQGEEIIPPSPIRRDGDEWVGAMHGQQSYDRSRSNRYKR